MAELTICVNCKHYRKIIKNEAAPDVWYNHFCYRNCKDFNKGNCPQFEEKK